MVYIQCDSVQNIHYVCAMYRLIVPTGKLFYHYIYTVCISVIIPSRAHECTCSRDKPWHSLVFSLYHTSEAGAISYRHHEVPRFTYFTDAPSLLLSSGLC